jgi:hypothetical protein
MEGRGRPRGRSLTIAATVALGVVVAIPTLVGFGNRRAEAPSQSPGSSAASASRTIDSQPSAGTASPRTPAAGVSASPPTPSPKPPAGTSGAARAGGPSFRTLRLTLARLTPAQLPYQGGRPVSLSSPPYPTDSRGVRVVIRDGKAHYAPVQLAQQGLELVDAFNQTGKTAYLDVARRVAGQLVLRGRSSSSGLFLTYDFAFPMHGRASEVLRAPWYSGMAQGLAASFFVRLARATGQPGFLRTAGLVIRAMEILRTPDDRPWVTTVDSLGYLWIEEYPLDHDHTLNGYLFALFGLYEYWLATGSSDARNLLAGGVAALRHYVPQFRNVGSISAYCLRHRVQNAKYHRIHIWQLRFLGRITGDAFFSRMSKAFAADFS